MLVCEDGSDWKSGGADGLLFLQEDKAAQTTARITGRLYLKYLIIICNCSLHVWNYQLHIHHAAVTCRQFIIIKTFERLYNRMDVIIAHVLPHGVV